MIINLETYQDYQVIDGIKKYQISSPISNEIIFLEYNQDKIYDIVIIKNTIVTIYDFNTNNINVLIEENAIVNLFNLIEKPINRKTNIILKDNAYLCARYLYLGAQLEISTNIELSKNATLEANYLAIANNEKQKIETIVMHKDINTTSTVNNYAISSNHASIVFETIGKVFRGSKQANLRQLTKGFIITKNAIVEAKPILLIDEFDVAAKHGASIGKISDEDLFYLMSRGLSKQDAEKLILKGIIDPFIHSITDENQQNFVKKAINNKL